MQTYRLGGFKMKAMLSQPMNGLSDEEIAKERSKAINVLLSMGI